MEQSQSYTYATKGKCDGLFNNIDVWQKFSLGL